MDMLAACKDLITSERIWRFYHEFRLIASQPGKDHSPILVSFHKPCPAAGLSLTGFMLPRLTVQSVTSIAGPGY